MVTGLALLAVLGLVVFWILSAPRPLEEASLPADYTPNVENGTLLYNIGGCIGCHQPGPELAGVEKSVPAGGAPLKTPIGTLYPPNLTPDKETGLGEWSDIQFVNAMQRGISPEGSHYIPAFPYTSYAVMSVNDVRDIKAYLASLPPVASPPKAQQIPAEFIVRRGLGLWKLIGLDTTRWKKDDSKSAEWNLGSYLVNGPGHCSECHTPRNLFMASDDSRFLKGGPHPEGDGKVPNLHGLIERKRYKDKADLVLAFQNGEVLGYDKMSSGGMGRVQANIALLPQDHVEAIAEYVLSFK